MEVIIQPDAEKASSMVARLIAKAIKEKPWLVLGLATGRTMEQLYEKLVRMHREDGLDFSLCRSFNLDEYIGFPPEDEHSYRYYMNKHLFSQVNIDPRNTHLPHGMAPDLSAECDRYEKLIGECGGVDLQLLGIGTDGHIGFNEPLSALRSRTRVKALTPATIRQNAGLFKGGESQVPKRAITMGVGTILEAQRVIMMVTGSEKADILAQSVEGPITAMVTATALQLHPKCTVVTDEAASTKLRAKEYYRWIFDNEPEWQEFRAQR
ncbi:MAG: glucosamine-6-phosphate deaminase [Lentisphaerota bacterium]